MLVLGISHSRVYNSIKFMCWRYIISAGLMGKGRRQWTQKKRMKDIVFVGTGWTWRPEISQHWRAHPEVLYTLYVIMGKYAVHAWILWQILTTPTTLYICFIRS